MHAIDLALARGVVARALKVALAPPGDELERRLLSHEGARALVVAVEALAGEGSPALRGAGTAVWEARAESAKALIERHQQIFGHSLRGEICAYETEYGGGVLFQQAQTLADIAGFYRAFGLEPAWGVGDRPDHVGCEFEFLEFLSLKEAWAMERGDDEMLEVTRAASRLFLRDHLGRFGVAFGLALGRMDSGGFYGAVGHLVAAFLRSECARARVPAGNDLLPVLPYEDDGVPMACGDTSDLVQIGAGK